MTTPSPFPSKPRPSIASSRSWESIRWTPWRSCSLSRASSISAFPTRKCAACATSATCAPAWKGWSPRKTRTRRPASKRCDAWPSPAPGPSVRWAAIPASSPSRCAKGVAGYIGVDRGMVLDHFRKAVAVRSEKTIERSMSPLRQDERMLLVALLTNAEMRADTIAPLRSLQTIETLPSRRIFQAIFALEEAGGRVSFDAVNGRLEEADQNLLAQTVLHEDGEISREEVVAALESMQRSERQNLRVQLKTRIGEAERAGRLDEAMRLTVELQGLEHASQGLRPGRSG